MRSTTGSQDLYTEEQKRAAGTMLVRERICAPNMAPLRSSGGMR